MEGWWDRQEPAGLPRSGCMCQEGWRDRPPQGLGVCVRSPPDYLDQGGAGGGTDHLRVCVDKELGSKPELLGSGLYCWVGEISLACSLSKV